LARRWARERLGDLLAGKRDRDAIVRHAQLYGLVSPYTSLVAVGTDVVVSGGVKHSVAVPVSVPSGMNWQEVKRVIDPDTGAIAPGTHKLETVGGAQTVPAPQVPSDAKPEARPKAPADIDPAGGSKPVRPIDPGPLTPPPVTKRPPAKPRPEPKADPKAEPKAEPRAGGDDDEDHRNQRDNKTKKGKKSADDDDRPRKAHKDADSRQRKEVSKADEAEDAEEAPDANGAGASVTDEAKPRLPAAAPSPASEALSDEQLSRALPSSPRPVRLTAALGGGLSIDHGAHGLAALDVRVETNRQTALGLEAALWLVDGTDAEGRVLLTVARSFARRFELGFGAGVHFGDGTGIATSARLRVATPLAPLGGYLRHDTAVLLSRPSITVEHAITLGIELSY
jgi:hypothetical protein